MSSDPRRQLELIPSATLPDVDTANRKRAVEELCSFIVQAPAGSGKTELLIQRYLALLATVEEPEAVVAITFTRKAAGEMRERVLKALKSANSELPQREHERERQRLSKAVLARDSEKGWKLTQNPSRLRILTIDSLCNGIVKLMPLTSRLGTSEKVVDDATDLYTSAAHRTLKLLGQPGEVADHVRRALEHLDNDVPGFERLLAAMLARRDQWQRHMPTGDTREFRRNMEATLRRIICERLEEVGSAIPKRLRDALARLAAIAADNLHGREPASAIVACSGLKDFPACLPENIEIWCGLACLLLTQEGNWRSERGINATVGFPTSDRQSKDSFIDLLAEMRVIPGLDQMIHSVRELPPPAFSDAQWDVLESLARLLPVATEQLKAIFLQEQTCDFSEIALAAQNALGGPETPTNLAVALGHEIRHLLVDEFQDTSINQVHLLQTLTSGWKSGDGRTIFIVGDPMQSIYRFRQAEVGSFLRVWGSKKFGSIEVEPLPLTKNFRSREALVDWINETFRDVFPDRENVTASAVVFKECKSAAKDRTEPSWVRSYAQFAPSGEAARQEAEQVVALVTDLRARGKKVAILVRSKRHLGAIVPNLRAAAESNPSLKFQAVEIETLAERSVVSDLRALTYAIVHLGHKVAWLAVLRAPWCGLSLHDLYELCGDRSFEPVWQLMQERMSRLSGEGRQRVQRIIPVLAEAIRKRGRFPLRQLVEGAWISLNGPACLREKRDLEDASAFFDLLDELDAGSDLPSLSKLEDSIHDLFAQPDPDATDAVQIMTIHKAKGLEFDTVILPGLGRTTKRRDRDLIVWDERSSPEGPELLMAPVPEKSKRRDDRIYKFLQGVESERDDNELRRLLYVAATRARHELYLFGHLRYEPQVFLEEGKRPGEGTLLSLLWPVLQDEFISQAQETLKTPTSVLRLAASADPAARRVLRRLPLDWSRPALPSSMDWSQPHDPDEVSPDDDVTYDWAGERARRVGTVVHAMLQRMAEDGLQKWDPDRVHSVRDSLRAALANQGVSPADMDDAVARTEAALLGSLNDDRGRWVLDAHFDAKNEQALTGFDGGQLYSVVMDRTFVADGVRWIVDYKTSSHEGGDREGFLDNEKIRYKETMERYARILKKQESHPIKIGLYFPLMRGWREWDPS